MNDLDRLIAIQDIKTLRARYLRLLDTRRFDEAVALYASDATMRMEAEAPGQVLEGPAAIREMIGGALVDVITVHHILMGEIEIESEDRATAIWTFEDTLWFGPDSPAPGRHIRGFGHIHDSYRLIDGKWFIKDVKITRLKIEQLGE